MSFFKKFLGLGQNREVIEGLIGYFNLTDWWLASFSKNQRDWIEAEYQKDRLEFGDANRRPLTAEKIEFTSKTCTHILMEIAIILYRGGFRQQSLSVFEFAESQAVRQQNYCDLYFIYSHLIRLNYRDREKISGAIDIAVEACLKQISLAPKVKASKSFLELFPDSLPSPLGYYQLAIIREKEGNFTEAIRLSKLALEQGWMGDWEKRIARCTKKLQKG